MKEEILEPNASFLFEHLYMTPPTVITGGNHFVKYLYSGNPVYIQPPKCNIKQGISKAGKKFFCDLIFTNENDAFIKWIEEIESFSQKLIFDNREKWFESELEMHDIENSFTSPLKVQKGGKQYILRSNVPVRLGKCSLNIYDESENEIDSETIKENTDIMCILEFQGIRCSARNFQIEIEVKQMMILEPSNLFEKCILNPKHTNDTRIPTEKMKQEKATQKKVDQEKAIQEKAIQEKAIQEKAIQEKVDQEKVDQEKAIQENELVEFVVDLESVENDDIMQIKKRNDVYYNMYREAKQKAKIARNLALSSYLEVKRIKNMYMLEDDSDSDSDEDNIQDNIQDVVPEFENLSELDEKEKTNDE
jgi:hypothetical protein